MERAFTRIPPIHFQNPTCPACRLALLTYRHQTISLRPPPPRHRIPPRRHSSSTSETQASPLNGYYKLLLDEPFVKAAAAKAISSSADKSSNAPRPPTQREETLAKARVIFGSRLAGPADRRSEIERRSTNIAGVLVPPRPEEPDNCCMSGCVNCVWDRYRDELEEWAAKSAEARRRLRALKEEGRDRVMAGGSRQAAVVPHGSSSMDDDGGGRESGWGAEIEAAGDDGSDLFGNIPVGIREFMRTEKLLKERRAREASLRA